MNWHGIEKFGAAANIQPSDTSIQSRAPSIDMSILSQKIDTFLKYVDNIDINRQIEHTTVVLQLLWQTS